MKETAEDRHVYEETAEIDLDLLGIARRRFLLITFGILVGVASAVVFLGKQESIYESRLVVLVGQLSSEMASTGIRESADGSSTLKDEILATHVELFRSPKIIQQAIDRENLERSVSDVQEGLSITKGGEGAGEDASLLQATYQDTNAETAAKTLQAIFDTYEQYIDDQSQNLGAEAAKLIAGALMKSEESLRQADREFREFVETVPALTNLGGDGVGKLQDIHRTRLQTIEAELASVRSAVATASSRRRAITEAVKGHKAEEFTDAELMTLLSQEDLARLHSLISIAEERKTADSELEMARKMTMASSESKMLKLMDLLSQRRVMRTTYGVRHPSVAALEAEIASVEKFNEQNDLQSSEVSASQFNVSPADILKAHYNVLRSDIDALSFREKDLLKRSEEESRLAKEVELGFMKGSMLKANLDRAQRRYDEVFKRLQEINLTNDYAGFSTDLLVQPRPTSRPVWPAESKIILIGLIGGLMLGLGLAMLAEKADRTFRNPSEVETTTGTPILAHFPILHASKLSKTVVKGSVISPLVTAFHTPRATDVETLRVVRTAVLNLAKKQGKQVFLLTSPSPLNGKSTVVSNLAVSMAQAGKRVLLIDSDLRRPMVAKMFGMQRSPGLSDFLSSENDFVECVHESEQLNLMLCPSGAPTSAPSELLESALFADFVAQARESFDMVFIDSPPVLAVTDPSIVALQCDSCLLVVQVERNNRSLVKRAADFLREQQTAIDGVIVNGRGSRRGGYGYSSYNYFGKNAFGYVNGYRRYYESEGDDSLVTGHPFGEQVNGKVMAADRHESSNGRLVSVKR